MSSSVSSADTVLSARALSLNRQREMAIEDNKEDRNSFINKLKFYLSSDKDEKALLRQKMLALRFYNSWTNQGMLDLIKWTEDKKNKPLVDRLMRAEFPDVFPEEGEEIPQDKVRAYLSEFVSVPLARHLVELQFGSYLGTEAYNRACKEHHRRKDLLGNKSLGAGSLATCRALEVVDTVSAMSVLLTDPKVLHMLPSGPESYYYDPHYVHFFDQGGALHLGGYRHNGTRRQSCGIEGLYLSSPALAFFVLTELDNKLWDNREKVLNHKDPNVQCFQRTSRANTKGRINREYRDDLKKLPFDIRLTLEEVKQCTAIAEKKYAQHKPVCGQTPTFALSLDSITQQPLLSIEENQEVTFDQAFPEEPVPPEESNVKLSTKLSPLPNDAVLQRLFPAIRDGTKDVNDKARYYLDPDLVIKECENFQKGDLDVMTGAIASYILSDFINQKGVPLDVLLACSHNMRKLVGLPPFPNRYGRYSIQPHQWLTEDDRKSVEFKNLHKEDGGDRTALLLNVLNIIQQNNLLSWDMKDALLLISSQQLFDRDMAKGGESCIRAAVMGMEDSDELPYFSLGKGKAVLSQHASIGDIAHITIANEFVNWFRAVQNDVARMICYGKNDASMFKWHEFYSKAPNYEQMELVHAVEQMSLSGNISSPSSASPIGSAASKAPSSDDDSAPASAGGGAVSSKRWLSPPNSEQRQPQRRRFFSPQKATATGPAGTSAQKAFDSLDKTQRELELEDLYAKHFFISGDKREECIDPLPNSQAEAYKIIREWCTVIHGVPPQYRPLERYVGNSLIQRAGPGSDYGPHTDPKPTLNQTASHPNKTLQNDALLPSRKRFPVFTFTTSLEGACAETSVLHGQFGGSRDKPCTCVETSANDGHYQPDGAQVAGKHKGQPSPNRPIFKRVPPELCPDLPREFLDRWMPEVPDGEELLMDNARFVSTIRMTPLGGKDLQVYATGYLLEKLDSASIVYNHHCYSRVAFGRIKHDDIEPTLDWHVHRGKDYFQEAVGQYEADPASRRNSAGGETDLVEFPKLEADQMDMKQIASKGVLGHQKKVAHALWARCHKPTVEYDGGLEMLPASAQSLSAEMPGIPVPQKTIRLSESSKGIAMNGATTQIMLRHRAALCIMNDDGVTKMPGPVPLYLHPDRKMPIGLGAIVSGDDLTMQFKDLSNDILDKKQLNQTANHKFYKQTNPSRMDMQIGFSNLVNRWDKLVRKKICRSKFNPEKFYLAGNEPRIDIHSTLEELLKECDKAMQIKEDQSNQQEGGERSGGASPTQTEPSETDSSRFKSWVIDHWMQKHPSMSEEQCMELYESMSTAKGEGTWGAAAMLLMPPTPCKDMDGLVDILKKEMVAHKEQNPHAEFSDFQSHARAILLMEQRHLPKEAPKLTAQQIEAIADKHSREVCTLAIEASRERKSYLEMLADCEPAERLLYTIYAAMRHDALTQIGSSGSATLEGANSMSASSSSPEDSNVKSAHVQQASNEINACFSKLVEMGNVVAHFVNLEHWMAIPREQNLTGLELSPDGSLYRNQFMCIGYWCYDHTLDNVRLDEAQCLAAFSNSQTYAKNNANFTSFMSSGCRSHYLKWGINFPTILQITADWNSDTSLAYDIVPVNKGNVGPAFGVGEVLAARKLDSSRMLATRVLSKTEFGREEWLCSHNSSKDLIWSMFKDDLPSLLKVLGALPSDQLVEARNSGVRLTASKQSLRKYAVDAVELCSVSANVMAAAALRATKQCYLPGVRANEITPLPLVCPGSEKLVPVVREGPLPCSLPSVDVARCFMRSEMSKTVDAVDPRHTIFRAKWVQLHQRYYKSKKQLNDINVQKHPGLRQFYEAVRKYIPRDGRVLPGVFQPFVRGCDGWDAAADLLTNVIYKAILFRTSGKVPFLFAYPKFKKVLADKTGVEELCTPDCLPPRKEAKIYYHFLKLCQSQLGFVMSDIQSDQHDKQIPEGWKGSAAAFLDYCDFCLSLAVDPDGIEKVRLYLRSVFAPAPGEGPDREGEGGTAPAEWTSSPNNINRLQLRNVIAAAIASCSDLSPSADNLKFLSHQVIGDLEASIPGVAGEVDPDSVAAAFGGEFGLRVCTRGMMLKQTGKIEIPSGESVISKMLAYVHKQTKEQMELDAIDDIAFLALQGYGVSSEGLLIDLRTGDLYTCSHTEHRGCKCYCCCAKAHSSRTGSEQPDSTSLCCHPVPGHEEEVKFLESDRKFFELLCAALSAVPSKKLLHEYPNVHYPKPVWHGEDQIPFEADWMKRSEGRGTSHQPEGMHIDLAPDDSRGHDDVDVSALDTSGMFSLGNIDDLIDDILLGFDEQELEAEASRLGRNEEELEAEAEASRLGSILIGGQDEQGLFETEPHEV